MQTQWRGPTRGNEMVGDQRSRRLNDMTSSFQVMSSCKSHENVVQGQLVSLGPGSEKTNVAARLHVIGSDTCVWTMLIWEHYQDWHGGGFCRVDPPMRELH